MKNKIFYGIIGLLLIGGMTYKLIQNKKVINENNTPTDRSNIPVSVSTFEANYFPVGTDYALPAVLDVNNTGIITATQPGKLATFDIEIGKQVTKGQLVGRIDSKQREIGIKSTEATIKKLQDDIKRTQDLIAGDAAPSNSINDLNYNLLGSNFIFIAIAIGCFFLIPNIYSYVTVVILVPILKSKKPVALVQPLLEATKT